ncbi:MAG: hypothetical protein O3A00_18795 [Planctomycetota bacterium]|nr:hypothetical protein [Planctomycetota bacterium]
MTDDFPRPDAPSAESASNPTVPHQTHTGFSRVGRMIRRRTTDFLAITIIAVGLIAVGGHLSQWWNTEAEELSNPLLTAQDLVGLDAIWGANGTPVQLDFGNSPYSLGKEVVTGDAQAAVNTLLDRCEAAIRSSSSNLPTPAPAEARLLKLVDAAKPVRASEPEGWALYRIEYPTTMIVGTRVSEQPSEHALRRVVCWGIALPMADRWTLFTIQSSARGSESGRPAIPLPPNARRTLSLRESSGAFLMGFTGEASLANWATFYAEESRKLGWEPIQDWVHKTSTASARYLFRTGDRTYWVDIQLTRANRDRSTGLLAITPRVSE